MQPMFAGDRFDNEFKRLNVVARFYGISVFEIDLMLARGNFMVRRFNFKAHLLKLKHDIAPAVFPKIGRRQVEVAAAVVQFHRRTAIFIELKEENSGSAPKLNAVKPSASISFNTRFKL